VKCEESLLSPLFTLLFSLLSSFGFPNESFVITAGPSAFRVEAYTIYGVYGVLTAETTLYVGGGN
jgi:hypothetical protein